VKVEIVLEDKKIIIIGEVIGKNNNILLINKKVRYYDHYSTSRYKK